MRHSHMIFPAVIFCSFWSAWMLSTNRFSYRNLKMSDTLYLLFIKLVLFSSKATWFDFHFQRIQLVQSAKHFRRWQHFNKCQSRKLKQISLMECTHCHYNVRCDSIQGQVYYSEVWLTTWCTSCCFSQFIITVNGRNKHYYNKQLKMPIKTWWGFKQSLTSRISPSKISTSKITA